MRELGLGAADVRVRVSDRRLMWAALEHLGFDDSQRSASLIVIDKIGRQPREVSVEKLSAAGVDSARIDRLLALVETRDLQAFLEAADRAPGVLAAAQALTGAFACLDHLGVGAWIDFDPTIVRGIAYYTGIVFELFDAQGEFRAICGGGRYNDLLKSLGGVDLPALGFGMGDVVLGELLRARQLMPADAGTTHADFFVIGAPGASPRPYGDALRLVGVLRAAGFAVDYGLNADRYTTQSHRTQLDTARKTGASAALYFDGLSDLKAVPLSGRGGEATCNAGAVLGGDLDQLRGWLSPLTAGMNG
jgi:histidyl-tRNA synthetase